jgi:glycosyltransferase involved in cell wall biosynthesis
VPVRDRQALLPGLLEALDRQTLDHQRFEVIIVDDSSADQTRAIAQAWVDSGGASRRHLVASEGKGPAHARNRGLRLATAEWIAFTDSDTLPDEDWLEAGLRSVESLGAAAIEGSVEAWPASSIGPRTHQVVNRTGGLYMTANMIYRRDLLQRLGGFDERFQEFLEDSDLAFRVMDSGYEIPFAPEVRVRHHVRSPGLGETLKSTRHQRWLALLACKHPDRYWSQLRPAVRPLSSVDVDVMLGLLSVFALPKTKGAGRAVLLAVAANGLRRGFGSHAVFQASPGEAAARATLAVALPIGRTLWWLEGCIRFRKAIW